MQKVVVTLKERKKKKQKFKSSSYRVKVWRVGELIRPEFGVLQAEGDYIGLERLCVCCVQKTKWKTVLCIGAHV